MALCNYVMSSPMGNASVRLNSSRIHLKFKSWLYTAIFLVSIRPGTSIDRSQSGSIPAMARIYLLSRTIDPLLGIFTGLLAYHLHETNPRSALASGHTLQELVRWQWAEMRRSRSMRDAVEADGVEEEWERMRREFEGEKR